MYRNMEDTLAARDKMGSVRAARRNAPGASSSLSGSLTANYSHHQKEWALQIRALQTRQVCCVLCFLTVCAVGMGMVLGYGGLSSVFWCRIGVYNLILHEGLCGWLWSCCLIFITSMLHRPFTTLLCSHEPADSGGDH